MKRALSIVALSALAACGGGGGSSEGPAPVAPETKQEALFEAPNVTMPNCVVDGNHVGCDLVSSEQLIGAAVSAGGYATFTNRTGVHLQIIEIGGFTAERSSWSEYCVYLGELVTAQFVPGQGEVGCATKKIGEDYHPIRFGNGLSVAPGEVVYLNSHTDPLPVNHTYTLRVQYLSNGGQAWRQPQVDRVIPCAGEEQATAMTPWQNTTGRDVVLTGASIYSETPSSRTPNTASGGACVYVLLEGGAQKYSNCDGALRTRGEVRFPAVSVAPGEYIAAQATNACSLGAHWNWAAFLNVR